MAFSDAASSLYLVLYPIALSADRPDAAREDSITCSADKESGQRDACTQKESGCILAPESSVSEKETAESKSINKTAAVILFLSGNRLNLEPVNIVPELIQDSAEFIRLFNNKLHRLNYLLNAGIVFVHSAGKNP